MAVALLHRATGRAWEIPRDAARRSRVLSAVREDGAREDGAPLEVGGGCDPEIVGPAIALFDAAPDGRARALAALDDARLGAVAGFASYLDVPELTDAALDEAAARFRATRSVVRAGRFFARAPGDLAGPFLERLGPRSLGRLHASTLARGLGVRAAIEGLPPWYARGCVEVPVRPGAGEERPAAAPGRIAAPAGARFGVVRLSAARAAAAVRFGDGATAIALWDLEDGGLRVSGPVRGGGEPLELRIRDDGRTVLARLPGGRYASWDSRAGPHVAESHYGRVVEQPGRAYGYHPRDESLAYAHDAGRERGDALGVVLFRAGAVEALPPVFDLGGGGARVLPLGPGFLLPLVSGAFLRAAASGIELVPRVRWPEGGAAPVDSLSDDAPWISLATGALLRPVATEAGLEFARIGELPEAAGALAVAATPDGSLYVVTRPDGSLVFAGA